MNTALKSLDLYCNDIGPKGGVLLSRSLRRNTTLTSLNLNMNNIGNAPPVLKPPAAHPGVQLHKRPDFGLQLGRCGGAETNRIWG